MGDATFELQNIPDCPAKTWPSTTRIRRGRCHVRIADIFPTDQPAPGQVRPGFGMGDATFELPTFSRRTSLHLAKYDQDWAWGMPGSNCPRFPDGPACTWPSTTRIGRGGCHVRIAHVFPTAQPAPGQVRPGLGVGNATIELPTFSRRPACTWPSTTRIRLGTCHVRIAHIFPTDQPAPGQVRPGLGMGDATFELHKYSRLPSQNMAKYDQDSAWEMPRSNCPHFPDGPACTWPSTTRIRRGRCHVRIAHIFPTDQPAPGQARPGLGVGNATIELPTFPDCPACTWPSTTRIWRGRCHVRIAHIFPTAQPEPGQVRPRSGVGMPRSNCPRFPTAKPAPGRVRPGFGVAKRTSKLGIACLGAGGEPHGAPF